MLCPHCGGEHPENSVFCTLTGRKIAPPSCPHCGNVVDPDWPYCNMCGRAIEQVAPPPDAVGTPVPPLPPPIPAAPGSPRTRPRSSMWLPLTLVAVAVVAIPILAILTLVPTRSLPKDGDAREAVATSTTQPVSTPTPATIDQPTPVQVADTPASTAETEVAQPDTPEPASAPSNDQYVQVDADCIVYHQGHRGEIVEPGVSKPTEGKVVSLECNGKTIEVTDGTIVDGFFVTQEFGKIGIRFPSAAMTVGAGDFINVAEGFTLPERASAVYVDSSTQAGFEAFVSR